MFELHAQKTLLEVRRRELVTSGSINAYRVRFEFSEDWEGLAVPGRRLEAGVYGKDAAGQVVLPAVWVDLGYIDPGAIPGEEAKPPTPELREQALARKGDHRALTGREAPDQHPMKAITGLEGERERMYVLVHNIGAAVPFSGEISLEYTKATDEKKGGETA